MSAHGGNLRAFSKYYNKREDEIVDFSSNVNPLGIPELLQLVYQASIDDLSLYPDPYAQLFCEKVANLFHVSPDRVITGNGSIALLDVAIRTLAPRETLLIEPCFTEYRKILRRTRSSVHHSLLPPAENFKFSLDSILNFLSKIDLLILTQPNNPTGSAMDVVELRTLLREAEQKGVFVIIDESFVDWAPELSVVPEVAHSGSLLVVRSMTKFFALAGIRSGFAIGSKTLIESMREQQGPWTCNRLAQKLSVAALDDIPFQERSRLWLETERSWLFEALKRFRMFHVFPSRANFFLVRSNLRLGHFFDFLGAKGIYVRAASDFVGLDDSYFRIAVRTRRENELLVEALGQWCLTQTQRDEHLLAQQVR